MTRAAKPDPEPTEPAARWLEYMRVSELETAPRNPNEHDRPNIKASIDRHGFVEAIVIDERTGRMVAGHGRREDLIDKRAAGEDPPEGIDVDAEGEWLVPVQRGWSSSSDADAEAYLVSSNLAPRWDPTGLAELLGDVAQSPLGLEGTGYDANSLTSLLGSLRPPDPPAEFKPYDPDEMALEHKCPKCGFEF